MAKPQIAFTADKRGRTVAYELRRDRVWFNGGFRWFRVGLEEARLLVATGEAEQVPYESWWKGPAAASPVSPDAN